MQVAQMQKIKTTVRKPHHLLFLPEALRQFRSGFRRQDICSGDARRKPCGLSPPALLSTPPRSRLPCRTCPPLFRRPHWTRPAPPAPWHPPPGRSQAGQGGISCPGYVKHLACLRGNAHKIGGIRGGNENHAVLHGSKSRANSQCRTRQTTSRRLPG